MEYLRKYEKVTRIQNMPIRRISGTFFANAVPLLDLPDVRGFWIPAKIPEMRSEYFLTRIPWIDPSSSFL